MIQQFVWCAAYLEYTNYHTTQHYLNNNTKPTINYMSYFHFTVSFPEISQFKQET